MILDNVAEERAGRRESDTRLLGLAPGEESPIYEIFRCHHCHKLRSFSEGADVGHDLITDPDEDAYLRACCDYCWATITQVHEEVHRRGVINKILILGGRRAARAQQERA